MESGQRLVAVSPPDGTTVLTLIQPPPHSLQSRLIGRATQVVFVTENLAATYGEWHSRGVRFLGAPRLRRVAYEPARASGQSASDDHATAWGGAFARFEDLDQNSFALVSFDEVSRAVEAQRQAAATVLGLFAEWPCRTAELQLRPGDLFAIYSDGITEALNQRDEEFGEERLLDVIQRARDLSPSHIVTSVFDEVRRFSGDQQRDDVTLIVARCRLGRKN